ncbi:B-cell differentiation antigen CD72-like [Rana temporaria]|uniref:B-cell differentiation antigen CD72-like n=1 Tax=Rana temporaria TaxID=8407 RepID=UPI001AAD86DC|nr:B-cell differentiation antigen CD72-like [Rana temporaria]
MVTKLVHSEQPEKNNTLWACTWVSAGLRGCALHLSLVFLLLCLILSAAVIGLTVKYVELSGDFQKSVTDHRTMSSSMTRSLRSGEDLLETIKRQLGATKNELEKTRQELRKVSQDYQALDNSLKSKENLLESVNKDLRATKTQLEKTRLDLEKAERGKTDVSNALLQCQQEKQKSRQIAEETRTELDKCNQDTRGVCLEGWVLYRKKCLWFSEKDGNWEKGKTDCESRDSNLIIVPYSDTDLKKFIKEKQRSYWVGKEWNKQTKNWEWPKDYPSSRQV